MGKPAYHDARAVERALSYPGLIGEEEFASIMWVACNRGETEYFLPLPHGHRTGNALSYVVRQDGLGEFLEMGYTGKTAEKKGMAYATIVKCADSSNWGFGVMAHQMCITYAATGDCSRKMCKFFHWPAGEVVTKWPEFNEGRGESLGIVPAALLAKKHNLWRPGDNLRERIDKMRRAHVAAAQESSIQVIQERLQEQEAADAHKVALDLQARVRKHEVTADDLRAEIKWSASSGRPKARRFNSRPLGSHHSLRHLHSC